LNIEPIRLRSMPPDEHAKIRILLADDDKEVVSALKCGLERHGFDVDAPADPGRLLSEYAPGRYDLILLGITVSKPSGLDIYRELKKKDEKSIVCFLSGFEIDQRVFEKVLPEIKPKAIFRKPIRVVELASRLNELVIDRKKAEPEERGLA